MWLSDTEVGTRFPLFTRANADEVGPAPFTPLTWSLAWEHGAIPGTADGWVHLGAFRPQEFRSPVAEVFGCWGGWFYNQVSVGRVFGVRAPGADSGDIDRTYFGGQPGVPPYQPWPGDEDPALSAATGERLAAALRTETLPYADELIARVAEWSSGRPDLASLNDGELVRRARESTALLRRTWDVYLQVIITATVAPGVVHGLANTVGLAEEAVSVFSAVGDVVSARVNEELWTLSRLVRSSPVLTKLFDDRTGYAALRDRAAGGDREVAGFCGVLAGFLAHHGHRGPFEYELASPTWSSDPGIVIRLVEQLRHQHDGHSPARRIGEGAGTRSASVRRLLDALGVGSEAASTAETAIASGRLHYRMREAVKDALIRVNDEIRRPLHELARRAHGNGALDTSSDLFGLRESELDDFLRDPASWRAILAERAAQLRDLARRKPPYIVDTRHGVPDPFGWPLRATEKREAPVEPGESLGGIGVSPGQRTGRVRVVLSLSEVTDLDPDDVLVCATTDPAWTPLLMAAGAVVCQSGAEGSHTAIVARELGIPAVMSVREALDRLLDGDIVTVDGALGSVTVVSRPGVLP